MILDYITILHIYLRTCFLSSSWKLPNCCCQRGKRFLNLQFVLLKSHLHLSTSFHSVSGWGRKLSIWLVEEMFRREFTCLSTEKINTDFLLHHSFQRHKVLPTFTTLPYREPGNSTTSFHQWKKLGDDFQRTSINKYLFLNILFQYGWNVPRQFQISKTQMFTYQLDIPCVQDQRVMARDFFASTSALY